MWQYFPKHVLGSKWPLATILVGSPSAPLQSTTPRTFLVLHSYETRLGLLLGRSSSVHLRFLSVYCWACPSLFGYVLNIFIVPEMGKAHCTTSSLEGSEAHELQVPYSVYLARL